MHGFPYWRLSGYYFFYFAFVGAFSPYFGLYLKSLSFSAWDISVLMTQMQLMRLFGPYLWGLLVDRVGHRVPIIRLTGVITLAVFSIFFMSRDFSAFLLAMALFSFFWVAALPLIETLTFDHLRENASRYSQVRLWGSIGFIVAVMGTGALLDQLGVPSLLGAIVVTLGGIVCCGMLVPEAPPKQGYEVHPPVGQILRQPRVRALLGASFSMSAAHGALYIFYSIYLSEHGYSKLMAGSLWSLGVLAEIGVFLAMSRVMRRFSMRRILLASFGAAVLRFVLIGYGVESLPVLVLAQLMHGLTFGSHHAASIAAVNTWFPGNTRSRGQALYSSLSFGAGGLVGGLAAGWAWDHCGSEVAFALGSVFGLIGLILVARWIPVPSNEKSVR
ncbi:MFS transporter [Propionivibrio limicola]|uniref:MFS transporter n=1 Tax=Propionivibrio limicola TaxID=167645 RepID=UPI0012911223|nr:MFS transporter [Propionivibrio limicola]